MERGGGGGAGAAATGFGAAGVAMACLGAFPDSTQPAVSVAKATMIRALAFLISGTYTAIGRRIRKVVPLPGSLVKSIVPSCSWTIRNVIANPMPEPSFLVVK